MASIETMTTTTTILPTIEHQIHAAAAKNQQLLSVLSSTNYAIAATEKQQKQVTDLHTQLGRFASQIESLTTRREKEFKDHVKYRDSIMKKFAYRVGGMTDKFSVRAEKEEKEYLNALQQEHQAKEQAISLAATLAVARTQQADLEAIVAQYKQAQADLDALYDDIFEGPSLGFPEEDEKEVLAQEALKSWHDLGVVLESEKQALHVLSQARSRTLAADSSLNKARARSRIDMVSYGGSSLVWDAMERSALSKAAAEIFKAKELFAQAKTASVYVGDFPYIKIASGKVMSDVIFDNFYSDRKFDLQIRQSQDEMERCVKAVNKEWKQCKERVESLERRLKREAGTLEEARAALQNVREKAFEKVIGQNGLNVVGKL